jgi:hypothetical protein
MSSHSVAAMTTTPRQEFFLTGIELVFRITVIVVVVIGLAHLGHHTDTSVDTDTTGTGSTQQLEEDEAGWDCTTMGNRICGPTQGA